MLKTIKNKKATAWGGLGIALFLCVLMALMPLAGVVENTSDEKTDLVQENNSSTDDVFALPDQYRPVAYDAFDPAQEQMGMRSLYSKAYLDNEGQTHLITTADPVHYLEDGVWEEIDLNIVSTADGWEVKKNLIEVEFTEDINNGVSVDMANDGIDPIVTGINPKVTMLDESGKQITDYKFAEAESTTSIGGNTLRYHMLDGFDLDYSVKESVVKQDLIIRERPNVDFLGDAAWFGLTEEMNVPEGYALYLEDDMIGFDQIVTTQSALSIRNIQTGEELATLPQPVVEQAPTMPESPSEPIELQEDYLATYFVRYVDGTLVISTMVEVDWLLSDERVFPISIDPSVATTTSNHGTCYALYYNYGYCYKQTTGGPLWRWAGGTFDSFTPFVRFDLSPIPSTATISQMTLTAKISYAYYGGGYQWNQPLDLVMMQNCGNSPQLSTSAQTTCTNGLIDPFFSASYTYGGCGPGTHACARSAWGSDTVASKGWLALGGAGSLVSGDICSSATTCATGIGASLTNAYLNGLGVGAGFHIDSTKNAAWGGMGARIPPGGNYASPSITVVYSAGADTAAPEMDTAAYDGVDSYVEGTRTMFATFSDDTGIDTSSTNAPTLQYAIDGVAQTDVEGTVIGTCTTSKCHIKATTVAISAGQDVTYNWLVKDTASTPNSGVTSTFEFSVLDVANAPASDWKIQVLTEGVNSDDGYSHSTFYDRQLTYWEGSSNEYLHEWDTSDCGVGSAACFDTTGGGAGTYSAPQWRVMWQANPNAAGTYYWGSTADEIRHHTSDGGFLAIDETHGPSMNLIHWYNTTEETWVVVGIGDGDTGITDEIGSGTVAPVADLVYKTMSHLIPVPTTFTSANFGEFALEQTATTYQTTKANWICVNSHGWTYFFRSTSTSPNCEAGYSDTTRKWSGFSLGMREDQDSSSSYQTSYHESKVKPEPDTFAPTIGHSPMSDSHATSRTFKFTVAEVGNPPSGLDIGASAGSQPTLYYEITASGATPTGTWTQILLTPEGGNPSDCALASCDWTYSLEGLERGSTVTYYASARDMSVVGGASNNGANTASTTTNSFEVGDPNMVFVVEWHDMGQTRTVSCSFQALFYDVTNEIEFHYDDDCEGRMSGSQPYSYYNRGVSGYQDHNRTEGATMRDSTTAWDGSNPHSNNFRISTGANGANAWETFDRGMDELVDYDEQLTGTSGGTPSSFYCTYLTYWNQPANKAGCNVNMDMPDNFYFNYFGTEYNGSDNDSRVHISRLGNMYFRADGIQALELSFDYSWGSNMIAMPNAGNSYSKAGNIAPYWMRWVSNYCYDDANNDCSIRTRLLPFEGKGTDVTETQYSHMTYTMIDSPIRVEPSVGDYLSFQAGMTVEPGVVFQIAEDKGISIDGACSEVSIVGNDSANGSIVFEGQNDKNWLGMAFTGSCPAPGTDDRHVLSYVDFRNTSEAAIAAGSRHGNTAAGQPSSNSNVGNFSMDHVSFDNVATAFSHGSGDGTVITMSDYSVSNTQDSCLDFAKDSVVTLTSGTMNNCNIGNTPAHGAIVVDGASSKGSLTVEFLNVTNAYQNLIDVDFSAVSLKHIDAVLPSGTQSGYAVNSVGRGVSGSTAWCGLYASCTLIENLTVTGGNYDGGVTVSSATDYHLENIYLEEGDVTYDYAGIGSVPTKYNAVIEDITTLGDLVIEGGSVPATVSTLSVNDVRMTGDATSSNALQGSDWTATGEIRIDGACGWTVELDTFTATRMHFSCSSSNNKNRVTAANGVVSHEAVDTLTTNALYARNSDLTFGESTVTSLEISGTYFGTVNEVAYASSNADIRLIEVELIIDSDQDGALDAASDCTGPSDCLVNFIGSADIWFGGLATVVVTKEQPASSGTFVPKADHYVQANYVDSASPSVDGFAIGLTKTDATGVASNVWVITADEDGNAVNLNAIHVWGAGGVNDTMPSDAWYPGCSVPGSCNDLVNLTANASFTAGDSFTAILEPLPVSLNGTAMDCAAIGSHPVAGVAGDGINPAIHESGETYTFEAKVTMETDVTLDDCNIIIKNQWKIAGSSAGIPTLTIGAGNTFTATDLGGGIRGDLMSATTLYPGLVIVQGALVLDNGSMSNIGYGASGAAIDLGDGASLTISDNSAILGAATSGVGNSIIQVGKDSIFNFDDSTITANGGTALKFNEKATQADFNNGSITNADVGIHSVNAEPQVWDYVLTNNDVGINVVNNPPPPPPPPLCVLGGPGVYYGSWRGSLSCTVTVPSGQSMDIKLEQYGWGSETSVDITKPDGNTVSYGPYYFASYSTYDPLVSFTDAGTYTIVLDDTWGDGGARMTASLGAEDTGEVDPEVCNIGGNAYNPSFTSLQCTFTVDPNRAFDVTLQTYSWASEAYVEIELSNDGGSTWSTEFTQGPYAYSNYVFYELGSFSTAGDYRITLGDTWGDGGQKLVATMQPAGSMTASFNEGSITGSDDIAISFGATTGEQTVGSVTNVNVTSPTGSTAFEIAGLTNAVTVDGLTVSGGDYGIDTGVVSSGSITFTNVNIEDTLHAAVYYANDMEAEVSGIIGDNTGAALKFGQYTEADKSFTGLDLSNNGIGIEAQGAGDLTFTDSDFDNTIDVEITGASNVVVIDGTVATTDVATQIVVSSSGLFERARGFDYTLTADTGSGAEVLEDVNVVMLDEDSDVASIAETDANGLAELIFNIYTKDSNGKKDMTLEDYTVAGVANVEYTNSVGDFRFVNDPGLGLVDSSVGNVRTFELVDNIDHRVCSTTTLSTESNVVDCNNWGWSTYTKTLDMRSDGTGGTMTEYDYNNGIGWVGTGNVDWTDSNVMLDAYRVIMDDGAQLDLSGSEVFVTGGYTFSAYRTQMLTASYPYSNSAITLDQTNVTAMATDSTGRLGWEVGQHHVVDVDIKDSVINGVGGIVGNSYPPGFSNDPHPDTSVTGSTLVHFEPQDAVTGSTSFYTSDSCIYIGTPDANIKDNTLIGCPAGVMIANPYNFYAGANGADSSIIEGNTFIDTSGLGVWFTFTADADDVVVRGNNFTGSQQSLYGVYAQSDRSTGMIIDDNEFSSANEAIYMRGALDWEITDNLIEGSGDASYAGIYELEGYGEISGNTLIDADGGILIDGVTLPPPSKDMRCSIGQFSYSNFASCQATITSGEVLSIRLKTDYWSSSEGSLKITKPDGTSDNWPRYTLPRNQDQDPLTTYDTNADASLVGTYTIETADTYGDGGQMVEAYVSLGGAGGGLVLDDNTIRTSAGRTAPSAVGIWLEDCVGSALISSSQNNITVLENAIVTDGCDLSDSGSSLNAAGGTAGSVYTVNVNADNFGPQNLSIDAGDSVRWRSIAYYDSDGDNIGDEPHDITSNVTGAWGSSGTLNLGSTYVHTFTTAATEDYHCSVHPWMVGTITINTNTGNALASTGLNVVGSTDDVVLDGTNIGGFGYGVEIDGGSLHLSGDAVISGEDNAVKANDATITSDSASLYAGSSGTALLAEGTTSVDLVDLNVAGFRGLDTDNTFTWNGGSSTAATTLYTSANGKIENMTWSPTTTMIHAKDYARILSVANNLVASQLIIGPDAIVDEGNLFNLNVTHEGSNVPATASSTEQLGLVIQSTDDSRVEYSSASYKFGSMATDGEMDDWFGTYPDAPFDDRGPGLVSGTEENGMLITSDNDNLYIALTGVNFATAGELQIYFDSRTAGAGQSTTGVANPLAHNLPFKADYAFVGSNDNNYAMKLHSATQGWQNHASCSGVDAHFGGNIAGTANTNTELSIPMTCIDPDSSELRILALVQGTTDVSNVYPTQTIVNDGNAEDFDASITIIDEDADLSSGTEIRNHVLIYQSYLGSNVDVNGVPVATDAKQYDVRVKSTATTCASNGGEIVYDWGEVSGIDLDVPNVWKDIDILPACPDFSALTDIVVDEDSAMNSIDLETMAFDAQDASSTLTWTVSDIDADSSPSMLLSYALTGQALDITLNPDQHSESLNNGNFTMKFTVTDSHGLSVEKNIEYMVMNVNDKPIISAGPERSPYEMPVFKAISAVNADNTTTSYPNFAYEGDGQFTYILGDEATNGTKNATTGLLYGLIHDMNNVGETMARELNQEYEWQIDVEAGCPVFSAVLDAAGKNLQVTESTTNEAGGYCDITLNLTDGFDYADEVTITYGVVPVNDAPEILNWDPNNGVAIYDGNGEINSESDNGGAAPWKISLMEDDENVNNLTFNLSAMKQDIDHVEGDLYWEVAKTSSCDYENFFELEITGDEFAIDLIKDATTTAKSYEVDYLQDADGDGSPDNGVHQSDIGFCIITVNLYDSQVAPSYYPNYDTAIMGPASYGQLSATKELQVRVVNVPENVPDYYFDATEGFDFHGVNYIIPKTMVPTTVTIGAQGDAGEYNYDHMIEVCMSTNGHSEVTKCDIIEPPAHGDTIKYTQEVMIARGTTKVDVTMDVLSCVAVDANGSFCDTNDAAKDRFWSYSYPQAHRCVTNDPQGLGTLDAAWSCPGVAGQNVDYLENGEVSNVPLSNKRAPMLEDLLWCNNVMSSSAGPAEPCGQVPVPGTFGLPGDASSNFFLVSDDSLPEVVDLIASASVPSFAPSIIVISAAGMFVSALVLSSRREDDEAELEESLVDDEGAVSPVIATILMVAITVVLSGVIYVWASSLADTSGGKGVPRFTFDLDSSKALDISDAHYGFSVLSSETDLATQAMYVTVFYTNASGGTTIVSYNLASPTVYGFGPTNSDSIVTFGDAPETDTDSIISTYNTGDYFYVSTVTEDGYDFSGEDFQVQLSYVPGGAGDQGSVLRVWEL